MLGVRPAAVTRLVRDLARDATEPEGAVIGCWVSPGWSSGLTITEHTDWPDTGPDEASSGLAGVVVAQRHGPRRVSVCGYLVDVYCLGVKNALGPEVMNDRELPAHLDRFFAPFHATEAPVAVPLELARHLVWGAVDYARGLGFQPHPDFEAAAGHLGPWAETSVITFGRDGRPFFILGPHDDPIRVMRTLTRSVGKDNFHHLSVVG